MVAFEEIRDLIVHVLNYEQGEISPETAIKDMDADSLAIVELTMELEDHFQLEISDSEIVTLKTVQEIVDYINQRLQQR